MVPTSRSEAYSKQPPPHCPRRTSSYPCPATMTGAADVVAAAAAAAAAAVVVVVGGGGDVVFLLFPFLSLLQLEVLLVIQWESRMRKLLMGI